MNQLMCQWSRVRCDGLVEFNVSPARTGTSGSCRTFRVRTSSSSRKVLAHKARSEAVLNHLDSVLGTGYRSCPESLGFSAWHRVPF